MTIWHYNVLMTTLTLSSTLLLFCLLYLKVLYTYQSFLCASSLFSLILIDSYEFMSQKKQLYIYDTMKSIEKPMMTSFRTGKILVPLASINLQVTSKLGNHAVSTVGRIYHTDTLPAVLNFKSSTSCDHFTHLRCCRWTSIYLGTLQNF